MEVAIINDEVPNTAFSIVCGENIDQAHIVCQILGLLRSLLSSKFHQSDGSNRSGVPRGICYAQDLSQKQDRLPAAFPS